MGELCMQEAEKRAEQELQQVRAACADENIEQKLKAKAQEIDNALTARREAEDVRSFAFRPSTDRKYLCVLRRTC